VPKRGKDSWDLTLEEAVEHLFYRSRLACDRTVAVSGSRAKITWSLADIGAARVVARKVKEMRGE